MLPMSLGMSNEGSDLIRAARERRLEEEALRRQNTQPIEMGNIGGYQPGDEWGAFFNALEGKRVSVPSLSGLQSAIGAPQEAVEMPAVQMSTPKNPRLRGLKKAIR